MRMAGMSKIPEVGHRIFLGIFGIALTSSIVPSPPAFAIQYSVTDLGSFGGITGAGLAVNESGVVVGTSAATLNTDYMAFVYDSMMQPLAGRSANDINEAGHVVG